MSQRHRRNDAKSNIDNPGWSSNDEALQDIREACLFGRESILTKLAEHGIEYDRDEPPKQQDPDADAILECLKQVEQICFFLVEMQKKDPQTNLRGELLQLRSISRMNQQNMLIAYRTFNQLAETMKDMKQELQEVSSEVLNANFAELHDIAASLSSTLYNYRSSGEEFAQEKDFWMTKNNQALEASIMEQPININNAIAEETEHNSSRLSKKSQPNEAESPVTQTKQHTRKGSEMPPTSQLIAFHEAEQGRLEEQCNQLRTQNESLQQALGELSTLLEKNNAEFSEEVQKYNTLLYQQQHQLKECEKIIRSLEGRVHKLEETNLSLRQQRFRDELMIEYSEMSTQKYGEEITRLRAVETADAADVDPQRQECPQHLSEQQPLLAARPFRVSADIRYIPSSAILQSQQSSPFSTIISTLILNHTITKPHRMNQTKQEKTEELVEIQETEGIKSVDTFDQLGLNPDLLRGIYGYGFEKPSIIQQRGILPVIKGNDTIAQAQSGTGKTATFSISVLQLIDPKSSDCQALILAPTRELAQQIQRVIMCIGEYLKVVCYTCVGGTVVGEDKKRLKDGGVHVVVGTPGRVLDLITKKFINTTKLKIIVLDEADEMLGRGFVDQMKDIIQQLPPDIQVALFSATMPPEILEMTQKFMRKPVRILVKNEQLTLDGIKQFYVSIAKEEWKFDTLVEIYKSVEIGQCMIFANKKERVIELANKLREKNFVVSETHGDMEMADRERIMKEFRTGSSRVLVSTDLLGRGIDIQQVNLIINYDLPTQKEKYIHRIGRAGRFGRRGVAINFVTPGDAAFLVELKSYYSTQIDQLPMDLSDLYK